VRRFGIWRRLEDAESMELLSGTPDAISAFMTNPQNNPQQQQPKNNPKQPQEQRQAEHKPEQRRELREDKTTPNPNQKSGSEPSKQRQ
jgi:hypothetical protein